MKSKALFIGLFLTVIASVALGKAEKEATTSQATEQSTAAESTVSVALCVLAGSVNVQAWDRQEVMARSNEGARIELRREVSNRPASKVQIVVIDQEDELRTKSGCQASSDIEINVPRGAAVQVQTRDGDIMISGVSTAYAGTQNGEIHIERVSRVIEVGSIGGSVTVLDSSGRMDLNSIGGNVVVTNAKPVDPEDAFEVNSVSGDIELERVTHARMNLRSVNGNMRMTGPLASGGRYGINTMSGDVTLSLPADASFRLQAKISSAADIITDFPVTLESEVVNPNVPNAANPPAKPTEVMAPPTTKPPAASHAPKNSPTPVVSPQPESGVIHVNPAQKVKIKPEVKIPMAATLRRLNAVCGTGDAFISLASFSGTLHLQKN